MRQDYTAPQLAILFDGTRAHAVYTCQQSQFLADWQHQQVNRMHIHFFPLRWAASGKRQVKETSGGQRYAGPGREQQGGARPLVLTYMHAHTATDGLGRATWSLTMPVTRSRTPSF